MPLCFYPSFVSTSSVDEGSGMGIWLQTAATTRAAISASSRRVTAEIDAIWKNTPTAAPNIIRAPAIIAGKLPADVPAEATQKPQHIRMDDTEKDSSVLSSVPATTGYTTRRNHRANLPSLKLGRTSRSFFSIHLQSKGRTPWFKGYLLLIISTNLYIVKKYTIAFGA